MDPKTLAKVMQVVLQENLPKIIRKIVKEETTIMKKQIIKEIKANKVKQRVISETPTEASVDDVISQVLAKERKATTNKVTQKLSRNPMLNGVLQETAENIYSHKAEIAEADTYLNESVHSNNDEFEEYPTMGNGATQNNAAGGMENYRALMDAQMGRAPSGGGAPSGPINPASMIPETTPSGNPSNITKLPDSVAGALTRDYSKLVAGMNLKKK